MFIIVTHPNTTHVSANVLCMITETDKTLEDEHRRQDQIFMFADAVSVVEFRPGESSTSVNARHDQQGTRASGAKL